MKLVLLLITLIIINFQTLDALGCSCPPPPAVEAALELSDAVFTAKCTQIEKLNKKDDFGEEMLIARFEVYENFKGPNEKKIELHTVQNTSSCNGYWFKEGEDYLVYSYRQKEGVADQFGLLGTSFCHGTKSLVEAQDDVQKLIQLKNNLSATKNVPEVVQDSSSLVTVSTDKSSYLLDENVNLTIENKTEKDIQITLACGEKPFVYLLKKDGVNWIRLAPFPMKLCGGAVQIIKSGDRFISALDLQAMFTIQSVRDKELITQGVTEGEYKFEFQIDRSSENNKIFSNEFTITSSQAPAVQSDPGVCQQDQDCRIVTSYIQPQGNSPSEYLISCKHKDMPLKEGEWIQEYNEYIQGKCVCDRSSNQCRQKN